MIAYRIVGELENQESIGLGGELYPLGQNIRGAIGYMLLDAHLEKIIKTYENGNMNIGLKETYKNGNPVLYFKDCLILCKNDGGELQPLIRQDTVGGRIIKEIVYRCNKCGTIVRNPVSKDKMMGIQISEGCRANSFVNDIVTNREKVKFKFEVILKGSSKDSTEYLAELMATIKFIEKNGLYIGKRKNKGLGKMSLRNIKCNEIGMKEISQMSDAIESKAKKDNGIITMRLVSDTIGKAPITGEDILRDIKNAAKFFDKDWHEYRDSWKDPKMSLVGKTIELGERKTLHFLDCKINGETENMKLNKEDSVISRGTQYSYQLYDVDKINSEFWNAFAIAETCRGIGGRTSFGKGQFIVS